MDSTDVSESDGKTLVLRNRRRRCLPVVATQMPISGGFPQWKAKPLLRKNHVSLCFSPILFCPPFLKYPFNRHVDFKRKMWERWVGWTMMRSQRSEVCSAQRVCHWCYARDPIDAVISGLRAEVDMYIPRPIHTYIQADRQAGRQAGRHILCVYTCTA